MIKTVARLPHDYDAKKYRTDSDISLFIKEAIEDRELRLIKCQYITENGYISILQNKDMLSKINNFEIIDCEYFNDNALKIFTSDDANNNGFPLKSLKRLRLSHTKYITANVLGLFLTSVTNLTRLSLRDCHCTNDSVFNIICNTSRNLTFLDLQGCFHITNLNPLTMARFNLNYLNISYCFQIDSLVPIINAKSCRDLIVLKATGLHLIYENFDIPQNLERFVFKRSDALPSSCFIKMINPYREKPRTIGTTDMSKLPKLTELGLPLNPRILWDLFNTPIADQITSLKLYEYQFPKDTDYDVLSRIIDRGLSEWRFRSLKKLIIPSYIKLKDFWKSESSYWIEVFYDESNQLIKNWKYKGGLFLLHDLPKGYNICGTIQNLSVKITDKNYKDYEELLSNMYQLKILHVDLKEYKQIDDVTIFKSDQNNFGFQVLIIENPTPLLKAFYEASLSSLEILVLDFVQNNSNDSGDEQKSQLKNHQPQLGLKYLSLSENLKKLKILKIKNAKFDYQEDEDWMEKVDDFCINVGCLKELKKLTLSGNCTLYFINRLISYLPSLATLSIKDNIMPNIPNDLAIENAFNLQKYSRLLKINKSNTDFLTKWSQLPKDKQFNGTLILSSLLDNGSYVKDYLNPNIKNPRPKYFSNCTDPQIDKFIMEKKLDVPCFKDICYTRIKNRTLINDTRYYDVKVIFANASITEELKLYHIAYLDISTGDFNFQNDLFYTQILRLCPALIGLTIKFKHLKSIKENKFNLNVGMLKIMVDNANEFGDKIQEYINDLKIKVKKWNFIFIDQSFDQINLKPIAQLLKLGYYVILSQQIKDDNLENNRIPNQTIWGLQWAEEKTKGICDFWSGCLTIYFHQSFRSVNDTQPKEENESAKLEAKESKEPKEQNESNKDSKPVENPKEQQEEPEIEEKLAKELEYKKMIGLYSSLIKSNFYKESAKSIFLEKYIEQSVISSVRLKNGSLVNVTSELIKDGLWIYWFLLQEYSDSMIDLFIKEKTLQEFELVEDGLNKYLSFQNKKLELPNKDMNKKLLQALINTRIDDAFTKKIESEEKYVNAMIECCDPAQLKTFFTVNIDLFKKEQKYIDRVEEKCTASEFENLTLYISENARNLDIIAKKDGDNEEEVPKDQENDQKDDADPEGGQKKSNAGDSIYNIKVIVIKYEKLKTINFKKLNILPNLKKLVISFESRYDIKFDYVNKLLEAKFAYLEQKFIDDILESLKNLEIMGLIIASIDTSIDEKRDYSYLNKLNLKKLVLQPEKSFGKLSQLVTMLEIKSLTSLKELHLCVGFSNFKKQVFEIIGNSKYLEGLEKLKITSGDPYFDQKKINKDPLYMITEGVLIFLRSRNLKSMSWDFLFNYNAYILTDEVVDAAIELNHFKKVKSLNLLEGIMSPASVIKIIKNVDKKFDFLEFLAKNKDKRSLFSADVFLEFLNLNDYMIKQFAVFYCDNLVAHTMLLDMIRKYDSSQPKIYIRQLIELDSSKIDDGFLKIVAEHQSKINFKDFTIDEQLHENFTKEGFNYFFEKLVTNLEVSKANLFDILTWIMKSKTWLHMVNERNLYQLFRRLVKSGKLPTETIDLSYHTYLSGKFLENKKEADLYEESRYRTKYTRVLEEDREDVILGILSRSERIRVLKLDGLNLDDNFCEKLAKYAYKFGVPVEFISLNNNPLITNMGRKFLYSILVNTNNLRTEATSSYEVTDNIEVILLNQGFHEALKFKFKKYRQDYSRYGLKLYDLWCLPLMIYSCICCPIATIQFEYDDIKQNRYFIIINGIIQRIVVNFKRLLGLVPKKKEYEAFAISNDTEAIKAEEFIYTKRCYHLNEFFGNTWIFRLMIFNGFAYYAFCIILPAAYLDQSGKTHNIFSHIIFGGYMLLSFLLEGLLLNKSVNLIGDKLVAEFSIISLLLSQYSKLNLYLDNLTMNINLASGVKIAGFVSATALGLYTFIMVLQLLVNWWYFYPKNQNSLWKKITRFLQKKRGKDDSESIGSLHYASYTNLGAKVSYNSNLDSLSQLLERFSTGCATKFDRHYFPQIILVKILKFLVQNVPNAVLQLITLSSLDFSKGISAIIVLISFIFSIISMVVSCYTTMIVQPSVCTSEMLKRVREAEVDKSIRETMTPKIETSTTTSFFSCFKKNKKVSKVAAEEDTKVPNNEIQINKEEDKIPFKDNKMIIENSIALSFDEGRLPRIESSSVSSQVSETRGLTKK